MSPSTFAGNFRLQNLITRQALLALSLAIAPAAYAGQGKFVFVAATNHNMPLSQFQGGVLVDGRLKDLGDAIAQRMALRVRYLSAPARRVAQMLVAGEADGVCYVLPRWLPGAFNWSQPLIADAGVLVSRSDAPPVHGLTYLANKPVGTVLGYSYAKIDEALGQEFIRQDAASMELNISKIQHGRMQYAVMGKMTAEYLMRSDRERRLRVDFEFDPFKAQCAFSKKFAIPFVDVQHAVTSLVNDGSIDRLVLRYR